MSLILTGMAILAGKAFGGGIIGTAVGAISQAAVVKGAQKVGEVIEDACSDKKKK